MPKRPAKYSKVKSIKSIARDRIGRPPAARAMEEKTQRAKPKHKKDLFKESE
jgi:hypothetical protein